MFLDDALGDGNAALKESLLRQYQQGDPKFSTDASVLTERLARKLSSIDGSPPVPTVDFSPPAALAPTAPEKAPDLSKFGTPVEPEPEPSTDDLSKFGTPVEATAAPAPAPRSAGDMLQSAREAIDPASVIGTAAKGFARAVPEHAGSILQGVADASHESPVPQAGADLMARLENNPNPTPDEISQMRQDAIQAFGQDSLTREKFTYALRKVAKGDRSAIADARQALDERNAKAATPSAETPLYQAGTSVKQVANAIPMTDEEKASIPGRVGAMGGAILPYAAATVLGGPAVGMAAGFTGMAASTFGDVYDAATKAGKTDDEARTAATKAALVSGVLGSLPLGAGKYAQSLIAKMAVSSAAFATAGEAQEAILQQIAKDYDPKAGYSLDQKRLIAELILGAGMGGLHHGFDDRQQPQQPQPDAAGPQPTAGAIPPGGTGPQPNADAGPQASASARANTPPPGPDTGTTGTAGPPPPGPDTDAPGAGNASDQSQQRQQPPPGAGQAPGADYIMAPGVRAKMERVYRTFTQGADPSGMSDGDLFNAVNEHLRDTSKTGYTAKAETEAEAGARTEAATARTERDGLIRKGWDPAWVDAMSPQQRRQKFQEAMAGGAEQPKASSEHAPSKPQAETGAPATTKSDVTTGKRDAPIVASTVDDALKASEMVREDRTPAQAAAGNMQLGHLEIPHLGLEGKNGDHAKPVMTGQKLEVKAPTKVKGWKPNEAHPEVPDALDLATSGKLTADRASQESKRLDEHYKTAETEIFGDRRDEWDRLNRSYNRAMDNAQDENAARIAAKREVIEKEFGYNDAHEDYLTGAGRDRFEFAADDWRDLAVNLREIENDRHDAIGVSASEMRYLPKDRDWSTMNTRQRKAVLTITSALNHEKSRGGDLRTFVEDMAKERVARYGGGHDAREIARAQLEELANLVGDSLKNSNVRTTRRAIGAFDAIRSSAVAEKRGPGEGKEAVPNGERVPAAGAESGQEEVTAEHHQAIEDVLGPMADKVQPVDIARAAELLADHPDMPPGIAFQYATIENAVSRGDLTVPQAEEIYGPEVKEILGSGSEGAHSSEPRADQSRAEPREERAGAAIQARVLPGSGQTGEVAEDTGAVDREDDQEPNTGRADAGREAAGRAESETAAGEGRAASRKVTTERGADNKPQVGAPGADTTGDDATAQRAANAPLKPKANQSDVAKRADRFQPANGIAKTSESAPPMSPLERAAIEDAVRAMMKRMLGDHAKLEFNDGLMQLGGKSSERWGKLSDGAQAAGMYYPYRHLIRLALTKGIDYTAFHEAYHASEYQLQTPQERALMNRETPAIRNWIAEKRGYSNEEAAGLAPEEVRAIGAEEYMKERVDGTRNPGEGVHVGIRRWWNKLWEALRALANKLRGLGFKTFKDIYGDLYEGKHADRIGDTPRKEADNHVPETFEEDLQKIETGREMVLGSFGDPSKVIKTFKNFWTSTFQPELVSDRALLADPLFARYKSSQAQEKDALVRQSESEWNYWNKRSDAQRIHFLDDLETAAFGRVPADPREAAMAKRYRAMLDENWRLEKQYGSQAAFVEDYFPHIWERPDDWRAFAEARSAQVGPTWFQKKRTIDYITDGLAAGLKLKYTNPVDIVVHRLSSGVDMRQRMELLHQLKDQGLSWEGVQGGDMLVRRGWRLINAPDRKQWVIAPDAQPLWKNAVDAKGLWQAEHLGGSIFRGWMALKNAWVPVKLAMSAFHPLHVLHINYSNGLAQGWDQLVKGRDPMAALKSVAGGFVGPLVAAPGATTGAVAGALLGSTVGMPVWGGIAGSMAGAATFGALKRAGLAHDLPHQGKTGKAAWRKRPNQQTPEEKAIVALMNDGGFVPQLSEQMKIGAQRSLAVAFQKALRKEATPGDWKHIVTAGMRRGIEKLQGPIFEQWIPALKTAAYLNQAAALLKRRPELLTYHNDRRVALRAIAKSIDNRFGEMFYGNLFWNRYLKDASIASFLSLGWNAGFVREFGGAVAETVTRPAGLLPPFKPSDSRRNIREATNKIPFAIAYMASSALILGMMSMLMDDDHKPPEGLDWIFPRVGGTNPDGSPRRLTNMSYIREIPMLMKHIQERGGNALTGTAEMVWNKLMFEPFHELMNNRDYYGYNIWDENAPIYKQIWQGIRHMWGDQSPMTLAGAKRAAELSGKEFPSLTDAVTHPDKLLDALKAKGVDLSMLGFGPAPAYVEKSSIQNRIGYLYQQHVAPGSRPHADEENVEEKMAVRTAIMIAKRDHDPEMMQAARERGRAIGLTPKYMAEIGKTPTDVYLFSRLPADDQKSILARATPEEKERYFKHASGKVKAELNRAMAK
jgi:hypothetical protein